MTEEIRVGSIVTLRGRVTDVDDNIRRANIQLDGEDCSMWILPSAFLTVDNPPELLKVGDKVIGKVSRSSGEILAIHEDQAWLKLTGGLHTTIALKQLERLPA